MPTSLKKMHNKWHRDLARYWSANPITHYEVLMPGCFGTYGLAPAHSRRRFKIKTKDQFFQVVAACQFCHQYLDQKMTPDECEAKVKEIIASRQTEQI